MDPELAATQAGANCAVPHGLIAVVERWTVLTTPGTRVASGALRWPKSVAGTGDGAACVCCVRPVRTGSAVVQVSALDCRRD